MWNRIFRIAGLAGIVSCFAGVMVTAANFPGPAVDESRTKKTETIVLAGGCFWGVEAVFDDVKGVKEAVAGYSGGSKANAHYELVSTGTTGHAESVQVTFDPSQISLGKLLEIYFSVVHDPTELNRQGPDEGTQYRSEIYYTSDEQKRVAEAYIQQLTAAKVFRHPIVTKLAPLQAFYQAEDYHQDYVLHCQQGSPLCINKGYVVYNDLPKLRNFRTSYPELVKGGTRGPDLHGGN